MVDSDTYSLLKVIYIYISQDTEHLKAEVPNYDFVSRIAISLVHTGYGNWVDCLPVRL